MLKNILLLGQSGRDFAATCEKYSIMYLKRVEMVGFKTFSQKTEIEFPRGFLAVVGPNGSGKSNLTDAIRFCLGESSPKAMRASKLEELVFAGTPGKKGSPFAEVTLTFDNSDGALPLEMAEVGITRRLDADGDSKFAINRVNCRLRDVHELLMGSGVGPGSFSVLGGKEVDMVLSADPKDRRAMLEETAGVNRYKFRKREAQRKLERTASNLTRLRDILRELEGQLEESQKQLARYEKYKQAQVELGELETQLALNEWARLEEQRQQVEAKLADLEQQLAQADQEFQSLRDSLGGLVDRKRRFDEQREAKNVEISAIRERLAVAKTTQQSLRQRASQLEASSQSAMQRWESSQGRLREQQNELQQQSARLPSARKDYEQAEQTLQDARQEMDRIPSVIQGPHAELRVKLAQLEKESQQLVNKRETLKGRKEADVLRNLELEEQAANYRQELKKLTLVVGGSGPDLGDRLSEALRLTEEQDKTRKEIDAQLDRLKQDRRKLEGERRPLVSSIAELEGLLEDRSALPPAVRAVVQWREVGTVGLVGELIKVPSGLESAYEAALGGHVHDIITRDRRVASRLIDRLKQERIGRVTFWPLDLERMAPPPLQLPDRKGVVGGALELLGYSKEIEPVLAEMLGRTAIMEDMPNALALYDRCRGRRPHLVTKQGEYLNPSGALTGGANRNNQGGVLSRRRLLDEAKAKLALHERQLKKFQEDEDRLIGDRHKADTALQAARETARLLKQDQADNQADLRRHQADLDRAKKGLEKSEKELEQLFEREANFASDLGAINKRLDEIEGEKESIEDDLGRFQEEETKLRIAREALQRRLIDVQVDFERKKQQLQEIEREIARFDQRKAELLEDSKMAEEESQQAVAARLALSEEGRQVEEQIGYLDQQFAAGSAELESLKQQAAATDEEYAVAGKELERAEQRQKQLSNKVHQAQVEVATVSTRVQEALQRLSGGSDANPEVAEEFDEYGELVSPPPAEPVEIQPPQRPTTPMSVEEMDKCRQKCNRLRNFLENFGSVNLGAEEDHQRLVARFDEMNFQVTDLESGADSLRSIMAEMDQVTVVQFKEAFLRVNETFGRIFTELFQGGSARLEMCDPNDFLDSGVEVVACPPGKKLQNLSLLSSGERALSAMAFLLALLSCKPSPMVILDELDAPLDDANVERVANRLLQFSSSSQFLVITHNRKTMEFADRLYGVTMEEPGVSRILSVKLTDNGEIKTSVGEHQLVGAAS